MEIHSNYTIANKKTFQSILENLRKMPECSECITAYGCGAEADKYEHMDVLEDFAEAIWDEELKDLQDDIINAFYQLYSMDFQNSYEGIDTFYENFYEYNQKCDVLRAARWFVENGMDEIGMNMQIGYDSKDNETMVSKWIDDHTAKIYSAYRKLMFDFEAKYL